MMATFSEWVRQTPRLTPDESVDADVTHELLRQILTELQGIRLALTHPTVTVNNQPLEPNAVRSIINSIRRERELRP